MSEHIVFILECIGTVAFAITGVLVAVEARLDFFGVCLVGCITAVGGGILRDVVLGITPPLVFDNLVMILIALGISIAVFFLLYVKSGIYRKKSKIVHVNNIFDSVGLGVFSVMGAEVACNYGFQENLLLVVVAGVLTGIGGGMMRDVLTKNIPFVLRKHIYAVASLVGILVFWLLRKYTGNLTVASAVGVLLVVAIRILASTFRWSLPKVKICEEEESV
ncbi:MAG: trimeric intracellular cation channel family protein [Clostridia bacterium]|nr:trimeric intracellular cation channel family protein [Clostridia bacterium]